MLVRTAVGRRALRTPCERRGRCASRFARLPSSGMDEVLVGSGAGWGLPLPVSPSLALGLGF